MNSETIPEFGIKRENEERRDGGCAVVYDPVSKKFAVAKRPGGGYFSLFSGGVDQGEDIETGILREVEEEGGLFNFKYVEKIGEALAHYRNVMKNVNRVAHATCLLVVLENTEVKPTKLEEHETFELHWVTALELLDNWKTYNTNDDLGHWIYFFEKSLQRLKELGYE